MARKLRLERTSGNNENGLFGNEYMATKEGEVYGRRYDIKGIHNLVRGNSIDFDISPCVKIDLMRYCRYRLEQRKSYHEQNRKF
ncbi:MAG: hypothetical protein Q7S74_05455 [Nanoarchaeota archaeon]|nr:hypothetical protein [Nanoarchaeota archaeon]